MINSIRVSLTESKGPVPPRVEHLSDHTGEAYYVVEGTSTKCPGCDKVPVKGEKITKIFKSWWHGDCGAKHLEEIGVNQAWIALALQAEHSPSRFTSNEIRAILRNLLRINGVSRVVGAEEYDEPDPEPSGPPSLKVVKDPAYPDPSDPWSYPYIESDFE